MMPLKYFDPQRLKIKPLAERDHDIDRSVLIRPGEQCEPFKHSALPILAKRILRASEMGRAVIFACGAHVLRQGTGPLLIDLMEKGVLTHLALNGAGAIHDFEMALLGQTCESVARYVRTGEFGLWKETGSINEAVSQGFQDGIGFGEAVGRMIQEQGFPYRDDSVLAAGFRLGVPVTVHVSIGQDIIHEHPNFDGAETGATTYRDFLIFTESVTRLEGGVFLNIGTAVMGPEVYLKALTMARNVAYQNGAQLKNFTTAVFDLPDLGGDTSEEAPKSDPRYYFRPYKTVLVRTVADGGQSYFVQGEHCLTIPSLCDEIQSRSQS
jgi:hypothetical protein